MRSYVRPRSLRRIFRYLMKRKIPVEIKYQWNNSLDLNTERTYSGIIMEYNVSVITMNGYRELKINITFDDGHVLEESISDQWYYAHGSNTEVIMEFLNNGPPCYLIIERIGKHG